MAARSVSLMAQLLVTWRAEKREPPLAAYWGHWKAALSVRWKAQRWAEHSGLRWDVQTADLWAARTEKRRVACSGRRMVSQLEHLRVVRMGQQTAVQKVIHWAQRLVQWLVANSAHWRAARSVSLTAQSSVTWRAELREPQLAVSWGGHWAWSSGHWWAVRWENRWVDCWGYLMTAKMDVQMVLSWAVRSDGSSA